MYLSNKIHVVSTALMCVGLINILAEAMNLAVRKISAIINPAKLVPDMLDKNIWIAQSIVALIQLIANAIVFYIAYKKTKHYMQLIPTEDAEQMAMLQKETNNEKISQLNIRDIYNLLMVWTAITLGVQFVYEITSLAYKKFIAHMLISVAIQNEEMYATFVSIYNSTHGFKYIGMLVAISIGIVVTGIFLRDRLLEILAGALLIVFLIAFLWVEQTTLTINNRTISVVWTSVIFHLLQTGGIMSIAVYLRLKFKGM